MTGLLEEVVAALNLTSPICAARKADGVQIGFLNESEVVEIRQTASPEVINCIFSLIVPPPPFQVIGPSSPDGCEGLRCDGMGVRIVIHLSGRDSGKIARLSREEEATKRGAEVEHRPGGATSERKGDKPCL